MLTGFLSLAVTLRGLEQVVQALTSQAYAASGIPGVTSAVGAHIRHCLDHVHAFELGVATGEIDYDHRIRGTAIEQDRELGLDALRATGWRLAALSDDLLPRPVVVHAQIDAGGRRLSVPSSLGRELAFVLSHTVHHSALVAMLVHRAGHVFPSRFGCAPATPAPPMEAEVVCAR